MLESNSPDINDTKGSSALKPGRYLMFAFLIAASEKFKRLDWFTRCGKIIKWEMYFLVKHFV